MEIRPDFSKQKLIPAIVQDYETNKVLMLAYVNKESYDLILERKETYFYSRSRNEIWHKGEKSGNFQYVKEMYLDCDKDTLLILVEQNGVACHTGNYSCFFNEVIKNDKEKVIFSDVIEEVYLRILDRKNNPKENSYTNYLLEEGIDKICKKIGEEATETVIAAKNKIKEETVGEICDLMYHLLVLMVNQGINLEEIEQKLKERHKIECNKKQFNIRGEY